MIIIVATLKGEIIVGNMSQPEPIRIITLHNSLVTYIPQHNVEQWKVAN
jgi:hypothetical protein